MNIVAALLLHFSIASAIRPWSGLPATEKSDQNWLTDKEFEFDTATDLGRSNLVRLTNSWVSGHFPDYLVHKKREYSLEEESANDIGQLVGVLHYIIPTLKKLKEQRDNLSQEYAHEFAKKLINRASDDALKRTLGRHVRLLYERCHYLQVAFLHIANQSGLFQQLNEGLNTSEFDTVDLMMNVLDSADHHDFGMFDRIEDTIKEKGLHNDPALKAFGMMSRLLTNVACGTNRDVDGLISRIGEIVHSEEPGIKWEIEALASPFAAQLDACEGLMAALNSPGALPKGSLKLRLLTILFEPCKDVEIVHYVKETALKGLSFFKSMHFIQQAARQENIELSRKVESLLKLGKKDEADALVGGRVLYDMRLGLLVTLAVLKELEPKIPKPVPQPSQNDTLVLRQKKRNPLLISLKRASSRHRKVKEDSSRSRS